eukprot:2506097-Prymnesium_polylepis.2
MRLLLLVLSSAAALRPSASALRPSAAPLEDEASLIATRLAADPRLRSAVLTALSDDNRTKLSDEEAVSALIPLETRRQLAPSGSGGAALYATADSSSSSGSSGSSGASGSSGSGSGGCPKTHHSIFKLTCSPFATNDEGHPCDWMDWFFLGLVLMVLILVTVLFEYGLEKLEHSLGHHGIGPLLLQKVMKELALLGSVSFCIVLLLHSGAVSFEPHTEFMCAPPQ